MKLIKNNSKKIKYSFVMGRLSKKIGDKFQYFPIDNWQNEIRTAKKFNFDGVEWIISDYSNPIFNEIYLQDIIKRIKKEGLIINSIYLDLIMQDPLHKISIKNLNWILEKIKIIQNLTKINRITFPVEENCRFYFDHEKKEVVKKLSYILKKLGGKSKISIETDISVSNLEKLLKINNLKELGLLIDIGNMRANGFDLQDYINKFSNKIYGAHIKYRDLFFGKSKILPKNFYELYFLKKNLNKLNELNDLTFQTYRSENNYITDMSRTIKNFNEIFSKK